MGGSASKPSPSKDHTNPINHDKMLSDIDQMFRSVNATHASELPMTDKYSSTSDVDVSTVRPMAGGASFTYTRNRYQKYEDKLMGAMRGGNGANGDAPAPAPGPAAVPSGPIADVLPVPDNVNDVPAPAPAPSDLAADTVADADEEAKKRANADEIAALVGELDEQNPVKGADMDQPEASGDAGDNMTGGRFDIGRQLGGMTVDREIENIRSFLMNTSNSQRGGNGMDRDMDNDLRMVRDNLLNNQMGGSMVFSDTSDAPVDYNLVAQAGGAMGFSATSDAPVNVNVADLSATSENPIDYNMMRGGADVDDSSSGSDSDTSLDDSSMSDEDSRSDSDSSISDSDIGIDISSIMKIQRGIDKRQNRSNFLRGDYVLTSNSDQNYKIGERPYFSSQSSEYQNEVASEFLNTLRSRNRS